MSTYIISHNGRPGRVPCPDVLPEEGDVLIVNVPFRTLAGHVYSIGDRIELLHRTAEAPHGRRSSLGNWLVKDKHFTSVWTNIEWCIAEGTLIPAKLLEAA